jgi:hypothetical protein
MAATSLDVSDPGSGATQSYEFTRCFSSFEEENEDEYETNGGWVVASTAVCVCVCMCVFMSVC